MAYKKRDHPMNNGERQTFGALERLNPTACRSARAWVNELISQNPGITKTVYDALVVLWGLTGRRGYGDSAWWSAVSRWRQANGYPPIGKGRPHWRRPANWMPGDKAEDNVASASAAPAIPVSDDQAIGELVMEWMESKGFYTVQFHSDGKVQAYRATKKKRRFSLKIEDVQQ